MMQHLSNYQTPDQIDPFPLLVAAELGQPAMVAATQQMTAEGRGYLGKPGLQWRCHLVPAHSAQ